jgi:hypothetical protein
MNISHKLAVIMTTVALVLPVTLLADTVIEINSNNEATTFMSNGKKARINTDGNSDYMIVDFASKTIYAIRPKEHQIINLNQSVPALSSNAPPDVTLAFFPSGDGPVIAGYPTKSYRFSADGENCGTIRASKEALNGTSIGSMLKVMNEMAENARKALGGFAAAIPACQQANMSLGSQVDYLGAPLQILDAQGQVQRSITKISKDVDVDASNYEMPAQYQTVHMSDKIKDAQQMNSNMDQLQKHAPQMKEMMRQMQETGRLPPEARAQMQRYQEMMEQQQQQR